MPAQHDVGSTISVRLYDMSMAHLTSHCSCSSKSMASHAELKAGLTLQYACHIRQKFACHRPCNVTCIRIALHMVSLSPSRVSNKAESCARD